VLERVFVARFAPKSRAAYQIGAWRRLVILHSTMPQRLGYRISTLGEAFVLGSQLYGCCANGAQWLVKRLQCVARESHFSAQTPVPSSSIYTLIGRVIPAGHATWRKSRNACCSIQAYVFSSPLRRLCDGAQPSRSLIKRLSELRPRTPKGAFLVSDGQFLARYVRHDGHQSIDGDHFFGTDIDRAGERGTQQPRRPFETFVHVEKRAGLQAVAPDLDLAAAFCLGHLAADRSGRLFLATGPGSLGAENVVVSRNSGFDAVIAVKGKIEPL
jgi:hypothetical protein